MALHLIDKVLTRNDGDQARALVGELLANGVVGFREGRATAMPPAPSRPSWRSASGEA